jgi:acyl-CoA reductase-like NAD-dependent aldehyde dehydrogenase
MPMSNDNKFGLIAGVFTQDINKALRVVSEFESGNGWRQLYELSLNAFVIDCSLAWPSV